MIALNRIVDLSSWDDQALKTILLDLSDLDLNFDIEATGFAQIEIELLIADPDFEDADAEGEIIVGAGLAITQPGDLYQLGKHRLFCGSALEEASWVRLMGEELAALIVTDPPYNVPTDGHISGNGKHKHREFAMAAGEMSPEEFTTFLRTAMTHAHRVVQAGVGSHLGDGLAPRRRDRQCWPIGLRTLPQHLRLGEEPGWYG